MALRDYIAPLASIATDLRIIRELMELDLATRERPVIRRTEKPRPTDTEVGYQGIQDTRPNFKRWFGGEAAEHDIEFDGEGDEDDTIG